MDQVEAAARPLRDARDLDPLLDRVGDARYVLLGEASHGTAEYYTWRAELSKRLIEEKGFSFLAVEGPTTPMHVGWVAEFDGTTEAELTSWTAPPVTTCCSTKDASRVLSGSTPPTTLGVLSMWKRWLPGSIRSGENAR